MIEETKLKTLLPREVIVPDSREELINILTHEVSERSGVYAIFRNGKCIAYSSSRTNIRYVLRRNIYKYFNPTEYIVIRYIYLNKPEKVDELYTYLKKKGLYDSVYDCFKLNTKTLFMS